MSLDRFFSVQHSSSAQKLTNNSCYTGTTGPCIICNSQVFFLFFFFFTKNINKRHFSELFCRSGPANCSDGESFDVYNLMYLTVVRHSGDCLVFPQASSFPTPCVELYSWKVKLSYQCPRPLCTETRDGDNGWKHVPRKAKSLWCKFTCSIDVCIQQVPTVHLLLTVCPCVLVTDGLRVAMWFP